MLAYLETKIKIAEERKELFAKFQKELLQQTIAVRVPGGFIGLARFLHGQKSLFSRPGRAPRVNFAAHLVTFWVLNFGQFGPNSPCTLIRPC